VRTASLLRCHVVLSSGGRGILEGPLDTLELDASRVTILQGPKRKRVPLLDTTVHGTAAALMAMHPQSTPRSAQAWTATLGVGFSWSRMWCTTWALPRRQKISDFLWRLWHRALYLGHDRRNYDPDNTGCALCPNTVETYEHLFLDCPVALNAWDWLDGVWYQCSGHRLHHHPRQLLLGPKIRSRPLRLLWLVLQGELLYAIWTQRCRSLLDDDHPPFAIAAVLGSAYTNIRRALEALRITKRFTSPDLTTLIDKITPLLRARHGDGQAIQRH
jgi:hypothetical protein